MFNLYICLLVGVQFRNALNIDYFICSMSRNVSFMSDIIHVRRCRFSPHFCFLVYLFYNRLMAHSVSTNNFIVESEFVIKFRFVHWATFRTLLHVAENAEFFVVKF